MENENENDPVEKARSLNLRFEQAGLHLAASSDEYRSQRLKEEKLPAFPSVIAADTSMKTKHMRRTKFKYLEISTQDQYIKFILADDPPEVSDEQTEAVLEESEQIKDSLKQAKAALVEKHEDIRRLAPLVQDDLHKAQTAGKEVTDLASQALDTHLSLERLRRDHPGPRFTVSSAEDKAALQVQEMQTVEAKLQRSKQRLAQLRETMKECYTEDARLRSELAPLERRRGERNDTVLPDAASREYVRQLISIHRALEGVRPIRRVTDNEFRLTYDLSSLADPSRSRQIVITLVFIPNSGRLSRALVEGFHDDEIDIDAVIGPYMNANDARGLVASVVNYGRQLLESA